jgi:2-keto-4-pentenoate hydratase
MVDGYRARQPVANPEGLSPADGDCTRDKVLKLFDAQYGKPVGYKAGLTNPAVQKRFSYDAPVWGALYAPMLLQSGATVEAAFGARPLFEADLLVRVSDASVMNAKTPEDVLAAIDQVIPFIELPDLVVQAPGKLNGAAISAINVGARLGVMGTPIAVQRSAEFANALRDMVTVVKGDGTELDRGKGSDVLEHPLNAVVWLAHDLARSDRALKPGDLISLGSFSKLLPPKPGLAVEVQYLGLPGNPTVSVSFK